MLWLWLFLRNAQGKKYWGARLDFWAVLAGIILGVGWHYQAQAELQTKKERQVAEYCAANPGHPWTWAENGHDMDTGVCKGEDQSKQRQIEAYCAANPGHPWTQTEDGHEVAAGICEGESPAKQQEVAAFCATHPAGAEWEYKAGKDTVPGVCK